MIMSLAATVWFFLRRNHLAEKMRDISSKAQKERRYNLREGSFRLVAILKRLGFKFDLKAMDRVLTLAGRPLNVNVEEFIALSFMLSAFAVVIGIGLSAVGSFPVMLIAVFAFVAAMLPWQMVKKEAATGREKMRRDMIELCAYMEASLTASVSPVRVLEWYSENKGLLATEIRDGIMEVKTGKPIHNMFHNIGVKYDVAEADEVALILRQGTQQGLSISKSLAELNRDFRTRREMELNAEASKVKPQITAILVLFALVATFTLVAGPSVYRILEQGVFESGVLF